MYFPTAQGFHFELIAPSSDQRLQLKVGAKIITRYTLSSMWPDFTFMCVYHINFSLCQLFLHTHNLIHAHWAFFFYLPTVTLKYLFSLLCCSKYMCSYFLINSNIAFKMSSLLSCPMEYPLSKFYIVWRKRQKYIVFRTWHLMAVGRGSNFTD